MTRPVHVIKIERAPASAVVGMTQVTSGSCNLPQNVNFTEINIQGLVDAKMDDNIENKERIYTTTITFRTCDKTPADSRHQVFRLTTVDGNRLLVGTSSRPYPIVREHNPYPGKPGDNLLKEVTVTWKSTLPMLYIIE